jgi:MYXO-CTERM domain-containing protein
MRRNLLIAAAAAGLSAPLAHAGMAWDETINGGGDAGSTIGSAQVITPGALSSISGVTGAGDTQDLYVIQITQVSQFSAITDMGTDFDTQLWLFATSGHLVTGNDDDAASPVTFGSALFAGPNSDATPGLINPGTYILAVSGFGTPGNGGGGDPRDAGNLPLANQATFTEHTGPDGPGGANPLAGWVPGADTGSYVISITGVPAPGALALLGIAGLVAGRRRRA